MATYDVCYTVVYKCQECHRIVHYGQLMHFVCSVNPPRAGYACFYVTLLCLCRCAWPAFGVKAAVWLLERPGTWPGTTSRTCVLTALFSTVKVGRLRDTSVFWRRRGHICKNSVNTWVIRCKPPRLGHKLTKQVKWCPEGWPGLVCIVHVYSLNVWMKWMVWLIWCVFTSGHFCTVCHKCYDDNKQHKQMIQCSACSHWIHYSCEGLSGEQHYYFMHKLNFKMIQSFHCNETLHRGSYTFLLFSWQIELDLEVFHVKLETWKNLIIYHLRINHSFFDYTCKTGRHSYM